MNFGSQMGVASRASEGKRKNWRCKNDRKPEEVEQVEKEREREGQKGISLPWLSSKFGVWSGRGEANAQDVLAPLIIWYFREYSIYALLLCLFFSVDSHRLWGSSNKELYLSTHKNVDFHVYYKVGIKSDFFLKICQLGYMLNLISPFDDLMAELMNFGVFEI